MLDDDPTCVGVWGLGFGVWGVGCGVWGLVCEIWVAGCRVLVFRAQGVECRVSSFWFKSEGRV